MKLTRKQIVELTKATPSTVHNWLSGRVKMPQDVKIKIYRAEIALDRVKKGGL